LFALLIAEFGTCIQWVAIRLGFFKMEYININRGFLAASALINLILMIYFNGMSKFYVRTLKANYNINVCFNKIIVCVLMILYSVSLMRYYMYNSIWALVEHFYLERSFIYYPYYLLGLRILNFTCQLTTFCIAIFINNLLLYFGDDDED